MDNEVKELAALALRNAFWTNFSALVNKYLKAAEGLDIVTQEMMMSELTSIYSRDTKAADCDIDLNIWTEETDSFNRYIPKNHNTIIKALQRKNATAVHLRDKKVFERRDGEWYFVE